MQYICLAHYNLINGKRLIHSHLNLNPSDNFDTKLGGIIFWIITYVPLDSLVYLLGTRCIFHMAYLLEGCE